MLNNKKKLIVGISGASTVLYGIRLLELLKPITEIETHLVISKAAETTIRLETSYELKQVIELADFYYDANNLAAPISSGSFKTDGMVIVPCSIKTLSGIANSYNDNLLVRAADVTLKEKNKLILCVRETPLHLGHLKLMTTACEIGSTIMPLIPAFYHMPKTIDEIINQSLFRVLNQFKVTINDKFSWN